ncbi:hypothetical protein TrRE_jg9154 [Triparma retinervis]|uniref:Uncharacterized protein n=1 Tax=Triparma retinervis TaxID=2557542 RepID=A0A9W7G5V5_9STRA|nr:hypothetical protein TrRE_jg9154 [Triparma retinervis]
MSSHLGHICEHLNCPSPFDSRVNILERGHGDIETLMMSSSTSCSSASPEIAMGVLHAIRRLSSLPANNNDAHHILVVGDSIHQQDCMGAHQIICALAALPESEGRVNSKTFKPDLHVDFDGNLKQARSLKNCCVAPGWGGAPPTDPLSFTPYPLGCFMEHVVFDHPTFERPVSITTIDAYSYSPHNQHTVDMDKQKAGQRYKDFVVSIENVRKLGNAFDTLVLAAGYHYGRTDVELEEEAVQEYTNLVRDISEVVNDHRNGWLIEHPPQSYPYPGGNFRNLDVSVSQWKEGKHCQDCLVVVDFRSPLAQLTFSRYGVGTAQR